MFDAKTDVTCGQFYVTVGEEVGVSDITYK